MLYVENDALDPYENLALESYLFEHVDGEDVFMLWRNRPAIVCGSYQNIYAEVDVRLSRDLGVALARRDSGGGTVYHDEGNVNYTFIADADPARGYERFIGPMVAALRLLGVRADMNRVCDIAVEGRKVSGSAQRVSHGRVLHHGTLLYDTDLSRLAALSNGARAGYVSKAVPSKPYPVTNLRPYCPNALNDVGAFMDALHHALCGACAAWRPDEACIQAVRRLADEKYRSWDWVFGRSPAFVRTVPFDLDGRRYQASLHVRHGVIGSIDFDGPVPELYQRLRSDLAGTRLDPDTLHSMKAAYPDAGHLIDSLI